MFDQSAERWLRRAVTHLKKILKFFHFLLAIRY